MNKLTINIPIYTTFNLSETRLTIEKILRNHGFSERYLEVGMSQETYEIICVLHEDQFFSEEYINECKMMIDITCSFYKKELVMN